MKLNYTYLFLFPGKSSLTPFYLDVVYTMKTC